MEAGKELGEPGDLSAREEDSEDLVQALLLEQDTVMDVPKIMSLESGEGDFLPKAPPQPQQPPVIRLAKSLAPVLKPLAPSWKVSSKDVAHLDSSSSNTGSIKILSPVGPYSSSSSSSRTLPQHVKIIKGNETRQITLAQASEMGLVLSSPMKTSSQIMKSPIKLSSVTTSKPKAIVIGSQNNSGGKQVIFQPGSDSQRIIRLPPAPSVPAVSSSSSNIIQLNNSKVQYVKVALPAAGNSKPPSAAPTEPPLKIALPPKHMGQRKILPAARRVILPESSSSTSPAAGTTTTQSSPRYLPIAPLVELKEQEDTKVVLDTPLPTPTTTHHSTMSTTIEVSPAVRLRKPCNCSKSQCLKLYCDCFANGEFCFNCNCFNCFNNLEHEEDRQRSIRSCLDRNPNAFRPKIGRGGGNEGERVHHKGCNCKRSSCLKNYCECYEAKIPCTLACRCVSCKNVEDFGGPLPPPAPPSEVGPPEQNNNGSHPEDPNEDNMDASNNSSSIIPLLKKEIKPSLKSRLTPFITASNEASKSADKKSFSFVTNEVISATCQCLLTQAEEAEKSELPESKIEALIIEEFGRCLKQIIDISKRNKS